MGAFQNIAWLLASLIAIQPCFAALPLHCKYREIVAQRREYRTTQSLADEALALAPAASIIELNKLSPSKFSQVITELQNRAYRDNKAADLLAALAKENPERVAEALRHVKELPLDFVRPEGSTAARILRFVDAPTRRLVLDALAARDRPYAENVAKQIEAVSQPPYATVPVTRSTDGLPPPKNPPTQRQVADFSPGTRYREALVHEYVMANEKDAKYVTTRFASHCIVVTLYNPKTKTGLIVHLGANTDPIGSFDHMLADIRAHGMDPKDFEARILGGEKDTISSVSLALASRQRLGLEGVKIADIDVMPARNVGGVALDLTTGEVRNDTRRTDLTAEEDARTKALTKAGGPAQASPSTSQPPITVPRP